MEDLKTQAGQLKEHATDYAKTFAELGKVRATKAASNAAAGAAIGITLFFLLLFFMVFAFTALAWWLAALLYSAALGFACVAGFFLLLILLVFALKKKVIVPLIRNTIIRKVYE